MKLYELTAHEIRDKILKKEISITEICKSFLNRIDEKEKDVSAFITSVYKEDILNSANKADEKIQKGEKLPSFFGMPIAIKDNICTKGMKTTAASKILENFNPPYDATAMEKINNEDMIIFGKTNMDEFGMGTSTENSAFFNTKNPWDLSKVPGGSSGGSAAAVAADMIPWALGSDTGGSIRQPAGFCGVVGLKPTYGLVSRYGLIAYACSLEQIGTLTKDVEDAATLLSIIAGYDEKDSTSVNAEKKDYTKSLVNNVKGLKVGVPKEFFGEGINEEVKAAVLNAAKKYEELGAVVEECSLNIAEAALSAYYIIAWAESSSNLGRFDGIRYGYRTKNFKSLKDIYKNSRSEGFGKEVKRRIMLGTYVLSSGYYDAYYKKAVKVRTLVKKAFLENLEKYDVLLIPASPIPTFKIGEKSNNPLEMYLADICTVSINVAGVPAISIPCGLDKTGMPIGMQLVGKHFDESTIIQAAYTYEQNTNFRKEHKPTFKGGAV